MSGLKETSGPLAARLADLSAKCAVDVTGQFESLQSNLQSLLQWHTEREKNYAETVQYVQDNYNGIIREAEIEAERLIAAATSTAHDIVASAQDESQAWTVEEARMPTVQKFETKIKLDVGGFKFTTTLGTLQKFNGTGIGNMFSGGQSLTQDEDGYFFLDRDGTYFRYILNFLRSPEKFELYLVGSALKELKQECAYYGLLEIMFPIPPIVPVLCTDRMGHSVRINALSKVCLNCHKDLGIGADNS